VTTPRFSASVAGRYMACPASANLDKAIPNWTPPDVDPMAGAKGRGTTLHELLEKVTDLPLPDLRDYVKILNYIMELRLRRRFQVWNEHTVPAEWLASKPWTTADTVLFTKDELHIVDYKFGRIPVTVIDNEQLLFYAASYAHLAPKAHEVHLHLLQPAADQMVEWTVTTSEIAAFMNRAKISEQLVMAGDTTFGPSDHCTFCPANPHSRGDKGKPLCPAMMNLLYPSVIDEQEMLAD
jgi:hypothetical protein